MKGSVEILTSPRDSLTATGILSAMFYTSRFCGVQTKVTTSYAGDCEGLMLWGVGRAEHSIARDAHVKAGGLAYLWDMGYFGRSKADGYVRVSINHQHPQAWLDRTPVHRSRWEAHGIKLREDCDPDGPIILVGLGPKSKTFLDVHDWEADKLKELRKLGRRVIFRPKPGKAYPNLPCEIDDTTKIETLLQGASLVVCRHSNVAVDAVIAGVPFTCEDGAAAWLQDKPYTPNVRTGFLRRLAYWQWKPAEAPQSWEFLKLVTA